MKRKKYTAGREVINRTIHTIFKERSPLLSDVIFPGFSWVLLPLLQKLYSQPATAIMLRKVVLSPCPRSSCILYNPTSLSIRLSTLQCNLPPPIATVLSSSSRSLNSNPFPSRPQKAPIALLISPSSPETQPNPRRPRPPLEKQNREDDTERETEGRSDQERGETAIPLQQHISPIRPLSHCQP